MELNTTKHTIEIESVVGDESIQTPLRAVVMVPGAGREAVEVLLEDATVSINAAEVQSERVVLDGMIYCQVVYRQGDDPTARALGTQKQFSQVIDMPGASPAMICRNGATVDHVEAAYENGHIVFNVVVGMRAQIISLNPIDLISTLGGVDGLQVQYGEIESVKLSAEAETPALLRQEVSLPPELDARLSLMDWSSVKLQGTSTDIGGVRVVGEVLTETLIGTGVPGRPVALIKMTMSFDQLVELPEWLASDVLSDVSVARLISSLAQEGDGTKLIVEAELHIAVRANGRDTALVLQDAYATGNVDVSATLTPLTVGAGVAQFVESEGFKGAIALAEGAPGVGTVLATRARPSLGEWSTRDGYTTLSGVIEAAVLYLPLGSDKMHSTRADIPFSMRVGEEMSPEAWVQMEASSAEASAMMNDRLEFRCLLNAQGVSRKQAQVIAATAVEATPAQKSARGMMLVWPQKGDSLWTIGKKNRMSVEQIAELNGGSDQVQPGKAVLIRMQANA